MNFVAHSPGVPSETPCPKCLKAGRTGVFLENLTAVDGPLHFHALRCRNARCNYIVILSAGDRSTSKPSRIAWLGFTATPWGALLWAVLGLSLAWNVILLSR